jgi:hypothetical protein
MAVGNRNLPIYRFCLLFSSRIFKRLKVSYSCPIMGIMGLEANRGLGRSLGSVNCWFMRRNYFFEKGKNLAENAFLNR